MNALNLFVNDELTFECDCTQELGEEQLVFLDRMDSDMARGIKIHGETISEPDSKQKATCVIVCRIPGIRATA